MYSWDCRKAFWTSESVWSLSLVGRLFLLFSQSSEVICLLCESVKFSGCDCRSKKQVHQISSIIDHCTPVAQHSTSPTSCVVCIQSAVTLHVNKESPSHFALHEYKRKDLLKMIITNFGLYSKGTPSLSVFFASSQTQYFNIYEQFFEVSVACFQCAH